MLPSAAIVATTSLNDCSRQCHSGFTAIIWSSGQAGAMRAQAASSCCLRRVKTVSVRTSGKALMGTPCGSRGNGFACGGGGQFYRPEPQRGAGDPFIQVEAGEQPAMPGSAGAAVRLQQQAITDHQRDGQQHHPEGGD